MASNINYDEIKECLKANMSVSAIAKKLGIAPVTALDRVRMCKKINRDNALYGSIQTESPNVPMSKDDPKLRPLPDKIKFNLELRDSVWAVDPETSKGKELYEVISILEFIYSIRRTSGFGKVMSCQKSTYGRESDPNKVELAKRKKKG